MKVLPEI